MELSKELLDELKCIACEKYLTCGPINIRNTTGEAICGRCTAYETEAVTRNKQYETVAKKLLFPCSHAYNGCPELIPFTADNCHAHEQHCEYRDRICPVGQPGDCEWFGPWTRLVEHCRQVHPNHILNNPCIMQPDLAKDSVNAYVVMAFDSLFLMKVQVCLDTEKIYYALRYLGKPKKAPKFKYKLDVQRDEIMLTKPGKVSPEGDLTIQIHSSVSLCLNGLLSFLGTFEGTTFTVTVQRIEPPVVQAPKPVPVASTTQEVKPSVYSPLCDNKECSRKNLGCYYLGKLDKMIIHERYYCNCLTTCFLCSNVIGFGKIQSHYLDFHKNITYSFGSLIRIEYAGKLIPLLGSFFLSSPMGPLICRYSLSRSFFEMDVITPLSKSELNKYTCTMTIKNTKSKGQQPVILAISDDSQSDWNGKISQTTLPLIRFDVTVVVKKI